MSLIDELKMDKSVVSYGRLDEQGDDREYWASKSPEERLQAIEFMRQVVYGYDPATARLERVFIIAQQPWSLSEADPIPPTSTA